MGGGRMVHNLPETLGEIIKTAREKSDLTVEELTALPGIGETLAQRIVDYREQHGDFTTVDGLRNVSGIGEKRLEAIREYITVG